MANIKAKEISRLVALAKSGDSSTVVISGNGDLKNVSLRKSGRTVAWLFRYKGMNSSFGYSHPEGAHMLENVSEAIKIVPMLRKEFEIGGKEAVNEFINTYHARKTLDEDLDYESIRRAIRPISTTWTLRQCIEQMLEDRAKVTHTDQLSPSSSDDYRTTMNRPECQELMSKPASDLTRKEIEKVRNIIRKKIGLDPARKLITHVRASLDYCFEEHSGEAGLEGVSESWWHLLKFKEKSIARDRKPSLEEIAKVMILAKHFSKHPAPKAVIKRNSIGIAVLHAFLFICLTSQRQGASVQLRCEDIKIIEGQMIAFWRSETMKSKRTFALPIPKAVIDFLPPLQHLEEEGFVFRSYLEDETPVSRSATFGVIRKLKNYGLLEKNNIKYFSPHDIRRTIVGVLEDTDIPAGASAVLDHAISYRVDDKQAVASVTSSNYHNLRRLRLKGKALDIWTSALLKEYKLQEAIWEPVLS